MGLQNVNNFAAIFGGPWISPSSNQWPIHLKINLSSDSIFEWLSQKKEHKPSQLKKTETSYKLAKKLADILFNDDQKAKRTQTVI